MNLLLSWNMTVAHLSGFQLLMGIWSQPPPHHIGTFMLRSCKKCTLTVSTLSGPDLVPLPQFLPPALLHTADGGIFPVGV